MKRLEVMERKFSEVNSGNVETLGNLRMDIKGGVHKSAELCFWIIYYVEKRVDGKALFPYCDWWLRYGGSNSRDCMSISNIKTNHLMQDNHVIPDTRTHTHTELNHM